MHFFDGAEVPVRHLGQVSQREAEQGSEHESRRQDHDCPRFHFLPGSRRRDGTGLVASQTLDELNLLGAFEHRLEQGILVGDLGAKHLVLPLEGGHHPGSRVFLLEQLAQQLFGNLDVVELLLEIFAIRQHGVLPLPGNFRVASPGSRGVGHGVPGNLDSLAQSPDLGVVRAPCFQQLLFFLEQLNELVLRLLILDVAAPLSL